MDINEIEEAVYNIAQDIHESTGGVEYFDITLSGNGYCWIVEFCNILLWSTEDDDREYLDEDEQEQEPLEGYLRRVLKAELAKLATIVV